MSTELINITFIHAVFWVLGTTLVYAIAVKLFNRTNQFPLLHPLIVTTTIIISCQHLMSVSISEYQQHAQLLSLLLGPATVALAVPLYQQLALLVRMSWRVLVPISIAGVVAPALSWVSVYLLDAPLNLQMTVMVKSITTPLAMDTAAAIGGIPALAAIFVITTGIVGAVFGPMLFSVLGIKNDAAKGLALGSVAHVIGTAKAISISQQCAAFSTLALCLNGLVTALLLPILFA
ncbi:MAG: LrgB family protein [Glaciecola sp.]